MYYNIIKRNIFNVSLKIKEGIKMLSPQVNACPQHKLMSVQNVLSWMANDYTFYYSCENCAKKRTCKKYSNIMNKATKNKGTVY